MNKLFAFLSLAIISALISCQQNKKQEEKLVLGVMSSMDFVPVAVAKQMGYFDKYAVNVSIEKFYSANERDAAFQSGSIDGTVIDYTGAILQKSGGIDLKLTSACNAPFCIMSGPQSNIKQLSDLKNKRIAVSQNTVIDFCMDMALQSVQISPQEVEKQEINKIPVRFEMMMNGKTDATALPDPFITIAKNAGANPIITMQDLGYAVTGIMFKNDVIKNKEKQIQAFYKAYNEAVDYIHSHTVEDIRQILIKEVGFPEELIAKVQLPSYTHAQIPSEKDLQVATQWLQSKQLVSNDFQISTLTDDRFVK